MCCECGFSWWRRTQWVPIPIGSARIDCWLLLTWHLASWALSHRKPMWQIKNGTPAFMSVNSIDLHNNLKNEFPRIRQGQTCFSVCYDACSICLIRKKKKPSRGCDRLEKQVVIGLTSRCIPVDTFWLATVNKSHFLLNNKVNTHLQTPWQTKSADASLFRGCKFWLRVTIIYSWGGPPCGGGFTCAREALSPPPWLRWESCQSPGETRRQARKNNNKSATCFSRRVRFKERNDVSLWLTQSEEDLSALNGSISCHGRPNGLLGHLRHWSEQK